jgi:hypothetical protein
MPSGRLKKAHLRECGALDRTLNVQRARLGRGSTQPSSRDGQGPERNSNSAAPPRIWTFLSRLPTHAALPSSVRLRG